jgi:uncharacterized protein YjeT (DUF2065 family)
MTHRGRPFAHSLRWLGLAAVAGLGAFHADLFWQRLIDTSIREPGVALRWAATVLLLAGLVALRSRGVPLFRDRRALVLWLAALVLHFGATPAVALSPEWLALPAVAALGFAGELLARVTLGRGERRAPVPLAVAHRHTGPTSPAHPRRPIPPFLPRPPPAFG